MARACLFLAQASLLEDSLCVPAVAKHHSLILVACHLGSRIDTLVWFDTMRALVNKARHGRARSSSPEIRQSVVQSILRGRQANPEAAVPTATETTHEAYALTPEIGSPPPLASPATDSAGEHNVIAGNTEQALWRINSQICQRLPFPTGSFENKTTPTRRSGNTQNNTITTRKLNR